MRALRGAAALLRGAAGLALAPQRVLAAGAGAQAAAELARRLDQGCGARHAATAAGSDSGGLLHGAAAKTGAAQRKPRARHSGKRGEKTADGRPKPDELTVADLVRRGWFKTEEAAVALLTRGTSGVNRYAFETAKPAADWLEAKLGLELLKGGVLPAAKAVKLFPGLLFLDATTLQRKWDALTLQAEQGGVGCLLSQEQAREAVLKFPPIMGYATDTLKRGWSMLTATEGGLGLLPEEAHRLVTLNAQVLNSDSEKLTKRVELLKNLGYLKAHEMVLRNSAVLMYAEETVRERAAWWKQTGLDHVKLVTSIPPLLGAAPVDELQARLDFLRLAGMSTSELNNAPSLFTRSLNGRLRARYFYTVREGKLERFGSINTMMQVKDSTFLAMLQGRSSATTELASELEVARYKEQVASAEFVAWREVQEALMLAAKRL